MPVRFKLIMTSFIVLLFFNTATNAQMLQDSFSINLIKKDIACIYNGQFNAAREINLKITKIYPEHPVPYLLRGLLTFWKNYPLIFTTPARISFEEDLHQCIRLSEKNKNATNEAEYLLANLCARGMLLKFYDDNNLIMKVIPLAAGTYKYLRHSFSLTGVCTDLYYYTGAYNFYRDAYPKYYPGYRPLYMLFPPGDMETGLKELHNAAKEAVVLKAEAYLLLSFIYLNFENKYHEAVFYCRTLHELYPENELFFTLYLKNLLLLKQYDEAEKLIVSSAKEIENKFFQAQLIIFKGIIQEKKYHNYIQAKQYYDAGINKISLFGVYGKEYTAYAYFGLSRISESNSDKDTSKTYRQKAMKLGDFKKINFDN